MAKQSIKALVIDVTQGSLEELEVAYGQGVEFEYLDFVNTVHKAIQYHMETNFDICFIGEQFSKADVISFFNDYEKLKKEDACLFIQVRSTVPQNFDRSSMKASGFYTVLSKSYDDHDKPVFKEALSRVLEHAEREEALTQLKAIVNSLKAEVNKVALERKRGTSVRLSTIQSDYIKEVSAKYKGLAEEFYEHLLAATESSKPFETTQVEIPEQVLKKKLPHLIKDSYKGRSHRVWGKLLNKHGIREKTADQPEPKAVDASEGDSGGDSDNEPEKVD